MAGGMVNCLDMERVVGNGMRTIATPSGYHCEAIPGYGGRLSILSFQRYSGFYGRTCAQRQ